MLRYCKWRKCRLKSKLLILSLIALLIFVACKQEYSSADDIDKQKVEAGVEISQENFPDVKHK